MFALLTWQVAAHGALRTLDERCGLALGGSAVPAPVAQFFADLGNISVALPVLLVAVAAALRRPVRAQRRARGVARGAGTDPQEAPRAVESPGAVPVRRWLPPVAALGAMVLVPAVVVPAKVWIGRPGPPRMAGAPHDGFFPSGHAATAAVAYGLVALLLLHGRRSSGRTVRRPGAALLTGAVVLVNVGVGVGLVRQGYHWPLDVVASWCLSGVVLTLWSAVCARWYEPGGVGRD
ncbi:phosphatase PAP2 family protein [Streptomyces catenulae]|uniref:Phosphatase PAP2 family protein n=1 Tax=Streptomyces catenulae TaxID=66875 RepID=A0ABV2YUJ4_9ACTN|nr:phosphatase PAP2 family protein [Streptomyces catenulae]